MNLQLYDTYDRSLRAFAPLQGNEVRMYACGPTVYDYAHIGNLRTYIFEDVLRRTLAFCGYRVKHVINITDVGHLTSDADTGEDKVEAGAKRAGKSAWEIAALYTDSFIKDFAHLNILPPTIWCRATDHIAEQIRDIQTIEQQGFTYRTADGIYFDTAKLKTYGHLARLDIAGLDAGARVDIGEKKRATDFALWKFSPAGASRQMEWDSPWGVGFPGWHIECSAMAAKYLGTQFDIHCGGKDHIPVHHCNEIAQAEVCHGTTLANFWLHGYFLQTEQAKMSKSSGAFLRLQAVMARGYDPLSYRYLCLSAHYRQDLKFTWASLDSAVIALERLRAATHSWEHKQGKPDKTAIGEFSQALFRDLNTPSALAVLWKLVKSDLPAPTKKATVLEIDKVFGLGLGHWQPAEAAIPADILAMAEARTQARQNGDWNEADHLREAINARGFEVEDGADGSQIRPQAAHIDG